MFGIGGFELFLILIFGFLIFGPEKLPEIARIVGKGIARFRQAQDEVNDVIKSTDIYDPNSDEPFKDPMEALDKIAQRQEEKRSGANARAASKPAAKSPAPAASDSERKTDAQASTTSGEAVSATTRQESFTERKARYERERAARKAAEAAKAGASGDSAGGATKDAASAATADGAATSSPTADAHATAAAASEGSDE